MLLSVTIYADELIFINMFVTFFLLLSSCVFSVSPIKPLRILFSCFVGGIYSLVILLPSLPFPISLLSRIAVCIVIVLISDSFSSFRSFLKRMFTFLLMNFLFAGFMLAVNLIFSTKNIIYSGGVIYYDIGLTFIIVLSVISYLTVVLLSKLTSSKLQKDCYFTAEIIIDNIPLKGKAYLDTGNSMSDAFTGKPVILTEKVFIMNAVPDDVKLFLSGVSPDLLKISDEWKSKIRFFPYGSIGGNGLLPAVKCDTLLIHLQNKDIKIPSVFVAVTDNPLSTDEFDILLPNSLSQYISRSPSNEKSFIKH